MSCLSVALGVLPSEPLFRAGEGSGCSPRQTGCYTGVMGDQLQIQGLSLYDKNARTWRSTLHEGLVRDSNVTVHPVHLYHWDALFVHMLAYVFVSCGGRRARERRAHLVQALHVTIGPSCPRIPWIKSRPPSTPEPQDVRAAGWRNG